MVGLRRRTPPLYSPSTDGSITMWIDPSDSTKVLAVGGGAITNGATIGTINTSGGTARAFTQWGTNARPTWESAGINGLGAVRCNSQIITTQTVTGFNTMSGCSLLVVAKKVVDGGACALGFSELDSTNGGHNISMIQMIVNGNYQAGGRRTTAFASFQSVTGDVYPTAFIEGAVFNYANAKLSLFQSGSEGLQNQTFQDAGTTSGTEPYAISIGGFAQETSQGAAGLVNCYIGEILVWNTAMTPDQLEPPHNYLRLKWGIL